MNCINCKSGPEIMEIYACDKINDECLNCCGCEDHTGDPWY